MSFTEAIQSGFNNYANFAGRSSRSAYWWFWLFSVIVIVVAEIIGAIVGTSIIYLIVALAFLLPSLAVAIRRLHDTGRSGWWLLIGLIPIIGAITLIVFYVQPGEAGANAYGGASDAPGSGAVAPVI